MKKLLLISCLCLSAALSPRAELANVAIHGTAYNNWGLWGPGGWDMRLLIDGGRGTAIHGDAALPDLFSYSIELDKSYEIVQIRIFPRQDGCCPERLQNFRINILDTPGGDIVWTEDFFTEGDNAGSGAGVVVTIDLPEPVEGQAVDIIALDSPVGDYSLQMAEFEIIAEVPPSEVNRALAGQATSNRPLWGNANPNILVDGNRSNTAHGLETIDPGFAYTINLGLEVDINRIIIVPRQDNLLPERLVYFRVSVHEDDGGQPGDAVWSAVLHEFTYVPTNPGHVEVIEAGLDPTGTFKGQYVRIESLEDPVSAYALQINEIEVYGVQAEGAALLLSSEPADTRTGLGQSASFAVGFSLIGGDPELVEIQWQKNGEDIPGANETTYTTGAILSGDAGALYRAVISYPGLPDVVTREATVNINLALTSMAFSNRPHYAGWSINTIINGSRSDVLHGDVDIEPGFAYEIRLAAPVGLDAIDILPRQDGCCPERLTNFRVSVHNDDEGAIGEQVWAADFYTDGSNPGAASGGVVRVTGDLDASGTFEGQWVRILSLEDPVQNYALQITEVEIYGTLLVTTPQILISEDPITIASSPYRPISLSIPVNVFNGDNALLTYQWNRNGSPISGATNPTNTIAFLQPEDEDAVYTVTLTYPGIPPVVSPEMTVVFDYNYARGAIAYSNRPLYAGWPIAWLVDGNRATTVHGNENIAPGFAYTVDLIDEVDLERIDLYPRQDACCPGRFTNLRVSVHEDNNNEIGTEVWGADLFTDGSNPGSGPGLVVSVTADLDPAGEFKGRWIQILSLEDPVQNYALQIAELEAIGQIEPPSAPLRITISGTQIQWTSGVLESAEAVTGAPWSAVEGASSPYTLPGTGSQRYYRLRQ